MIGDKRIRHLTRASTLNYIPSSDYGKNGDTVFVKNDKTNSTEQFVKQEGSWVSLSTGRGSLDVKRRAGKRGSGATTVQNITVNEAENTGVNATAHYELAELDDDDHPQYVHNTTARTVSASHTFSGNPAFSGQPSFTKSGTPFTVTSTTKVDNLNADKLDDKQPGTGVGDIAFYDGSGMVVDSNLFLGQSDSVFFKLADNETVTGRPSFNGGDSGNSPFTVNSTVVVSSLNADKLDGYDESSFFKLADNETVTGVPAFNGGDNSNAPFSVDSSIEVANLNASLLSGKDWDAPLAIGGTTAAAGTFTTLTGTSLDLNGNMTITGSITGDAASSGNLAISSGGNVSIEGTTFSGNDVTIPGDLTVSGDTVTMSTETVQVEDQNIYLAYNNTTGDAAAQNAAANAGGVSLKAAEDKHFVWYSATDRWTASEDVEAPGLYLKTNTETKISFQDTASDAMSYIGTTNAGDIIFTAPTSKGVTVHADNHFGGTSFVSGFAGSGWRITKDASSEYNAEFDNLIVRGTMSVYELLIQQIRATNGSLIIGSADKVDDATQVSGKRYKFTIESDGGDSFIHFTDNDLIIAQKWAGTSGDPPYSPVKRVRATVNETSLTTIGTEDSCDTTYQDKTVTHDANAIIVAGMQVSGAGIPTGTRIDSITSSTEFELDQKATATATDVTLTFKSKLLSTEFEATLYSTDTIASTDLPLDFVRIGNTSDTDRQGGIYLTADDSGAPFIDIFDKVSSFPDWRSVGYCDENVALHTTEALCDAGATAHTDNSGGHWNISKTKARLDRLDGITHNGTALTGYGLHSENVYLTGNITATSGYIGTTDNGFTITGNTIHNGNFYLNANAETLRLGTITDFTNDDNTKSGIYMGKDGSDYEFFVGKEATQYLHYNGDTLQIRGTIQLSDGTEVVGAGMNWLGAWASGTTYAVNDGVSNDGVSYICTAVTTGNEPPNSSYWDVMADQGATGAAGAAGADGEDGEDGATGPIGPIGPNFDFLDGNTSDLVGTTTSAGLHLTSNYMGYHSNITSGMNQAQVNATFATYMDSSGNFYLGGTSGPLTWTASTSTLDVNRITATTGTIGAFSIDDNSIYTGSSQSSAGTDDGVNGISLRLWRNASVAGTHNFRSDQTKMRGLSLQWHRAANAGLMVFGDILTDASGNPSYTTPALNGWMGIQAGFYNTNDVAFQLGFNAHDGNGGQHHEIAGWRFSKDSIWKDSSGYIGLTTNPSVDVGSVPSFFAGATASTGAEATISFGSDGKIRGSGIIVRDEVYSGHGDASDKQEWHMESSRLFGDGADGNCTIYKTDDAERTYTSSQYGDVVAKSLTGSSNNPHWYLMRDAYFETLTFDCTNTSTDGNAGSIYLHTNGYRLFVRDKIVFKSYSSYSAYLRQNGGNGTDGGDGASGSYESGSAAAGGTAGNAGYEVHQQEAGAPGAVTLVGGKVGRDGKAGGIGGTHAGESYTGVFEPGGAGLGGLPGWSQSTAYRTHAGAGGASGGAGGQGEDGVSSGSSNNFTGLAGDGSQSVGGAGGSSSSTGASTKIQSLDPHITQLARDVFGTNSYYTYRLSGGASGGSGGSGAGGGAGVKFEIENGQPGDVDTRCNGGAGGGSGGSGASGGFMMCYARIIEKTGSGSGKFYIQATGGDGGDGGDGGAGATTNVVP